MLKVYDGSDFVVKRDRELVIRDTSSQTEQVGYVTIEQQVMSLMISGERLQSFKRQAYDFPDGNFDLDAVKPDPTMNVGFDFADYSFYESELAKKLKAAKAAKAAKKAEEVSEGKSSLGVPSPSDDAPEVKE